METFKEYIEKLDKLEFEKMYENDFFLTWEKTRDELKLFSQLPIHYVI